MTARVLFTLFLLSGTALAQSYPTPTFQGVTIQSDPSTANQAVRKGYLDGRLQPLVQQNGGDTSATTALAPGATAARTLAARTLDVFSAADDGMKCDGTTNDAPALNAALARMRSTAAMGLRTSYGLRLQLPAGRCVLGAGIVATLSGNHALELVGQGRDGTELVWTADADGLTFTLDSAGAWLRDTVPGTSGATVAIRDLSLVRSVASEGRTAITVGSVATQNPGAMQFTLRGVTMRGTAGAAAWKNGYTLTNLTGTLVEDLYFHVAHSTGAGTGTVGTYATTGNFISTEHHITRGNTQGQDVCYRFGGKVQGVTIDHTSCVSARIGVVGTSDDGTNDSLLVTSSHWDTAVAAFQVSGWNNVSVVNNYLLANGGGVNGWAGLAVTQGARHALTGNHVFGKPGSTGQTLAVVNNNTGLDTQVSISVTGNSAEYLTGPMVQLLGSTASAQVVGNLCWNCGSLGTDARALSTWAANTINGKVVPFGLDGSVPLGTGTQGKLSADASGNVTVGAPSVAVPGTLLLGSASAGSLSADAGGNISVGAPNMLVPNTVLFGSGSTKASVAANAGGTLTITAPSLVVAGTLSSPAMVGTPTAPTPATGDSGATVATTAFVQAARPNTAPAFQVFNGSGTFVPASGTTFVRFRLFGPGGNGGAGVTCTSGGSCSGGGGGGAGGMREFAIQRSQIPAGGCSVTVGAAGTDTIVNCGTGLVATAFRGGKGRDGQNGAQAGGGGGGGVMNYGRDATGTGTGQSDIYAGSGSSAAPLTTSWGGNGGSTGQCYSGYDTNYGPTGGSSGAGLNAGVVVGSGTCGGGLNLNSNTTRTLQLQDIGCEPNIGGSPGVASTSAASGAGTVGGTPSAGGGGGGSGTVSGGAGGAGGAGRVCVWQG